LRYEIFHQPIEFDLLKRLSIALVAGFRLFERLQQNRVDGLDPIDESLLEDERYETFVKGSLLINLVISWIALNHRRISA
jgi:hypothetical protein